MLMRNRTTTPPLSGVWRQPRRLNAGMPSVWLMVLGLIGSAVYFSGLHIGYYGDDFGYVYPDPAARIFYYFYQPNPYIVNYRPVTSFLLATIQTLFGLATWPIRVTHIFFHVLLCWFLYVFMMRQGLSRLQAMVGSLFLLLSQVNAIAVFSNDTFSQISGTFFGYAALWLLYRSLAPSDNSQGGNRKSVHYRYYVLSVLAVSISLLAKETSVSFLLLSFGVILAMNWQAQDWGSTIKTCMIQIFPFALATLLYVIVRLHLGLAQPGGGSAGHNFGIGINVLRNLALFFLAAIVPVSTATTFVLFKKADLVAAGLVMILSLVFLGLVIHGIRRARPRWFFGLVGGLAIVGLFPMMFLMHVSELYLYNSMPFVALLVGASLGGLIESNTTKPARLIASIAIVACFFVSHVVAIQTKAPLMRANGERAADLLEQIRPYTSAVPRNGKLFLVNPASTQAEYSVFLLNGFNVLKYGENMIYQVANRSDFLAEIVEASDVGRVAIGKNGAASGHDSLVLTLYGGKVQPSGSPRR